MALVLATALLLRLGFVLLYPQVPPVIGDDRMYDQVAWSLATGNGFSGGFAGQTERPGRPAQLDIQGSPEIGIGPVYPALLAVIYWVFGHAFWVVRVAQALLGCLAVVVMYRLAADAFGAAVARLSAVLMAVYPAFIIYSGVLLTETLSVALLAVLIWMVHRAIQLSSSRRWALAGAVAGLAVLLREEILLLLPVLIGAGLWLAPNRVRLKHIAVLGLVTVLTVGVWTARNYVIFGRFILVSAHGGDTLWLSAKGWSEWQYDDAELIALTAGLDYVEQNEALRREGMRIIIDDPLGYLRTCVARLPDFWLTSHTTYLVGFQETFGTYYQREEYWRLAVKLLLFGINLAVITLASFGISTTMRPGGQPWPGVLLFLPIVVVAAVHFFLFATPRYQVPIMPFVLVFASVGVLKMGVGRVVQLGRSPAPAHAQ